MHYLDSGVNRQESAMWRSRAGKTLSALTLSAALAGCFNSTSPDAHTPPPAHLPKGKNTPTLVVPLPTNEPTTIPEVTPTLTPLEQISAATGKFPRDHKEIHLWNNINKNMNKLPHTGLASNLAFFYLGNILSGMTKSNNQHFRDASQELLSALPNGQSEVKIEFLDVLPTKGTTLVVFAPSQTQADFTLIVSSRAILEQNNPLDAAAELVEDAAYIKHVKQVRSLLRTDDATTIIQYIRNHPAISADQFATRYEALLEQFGKLNVVYLHNMLQSNIDGLVNYARCEQQVNSKACWDAYFIKNHPQPAPLPTATSQSA